MFVLLKYILHNFFFYFRRLYPPHLLTTAERKLHYRTFSNRVLSKKKKKKSLDRQTQVKLNLFSFTKVFVPLMQKKKKKIKPPQFMCTAICIFFSLLLLLFVKVEVLCSRLAISRATEVHFPQTDVSVRVRGSVSCLSVCSNSEDG